MSTFKFDVKLACEITVESADALRAEEALSEIFDCISNSNAITDVHRAIVDITFEIDDSDGPFLVDDDEEAGDE